MDAEIHCHGITGSIRALPSPRHSATALVLSSMTGEDSLLRRPSLDDDFIILLRALRSMGLIAEMRSGDLLVNSVDMGMTAERMDVGMSETAFCLVSALASNIPRRCIIDGSMPSDFPMHPYINALLNLGVTCEFPRQDWQLPLNMRGPHQSHMTYLPGDSPSIMFLSLTLSSLYGVRPTRIEAVGPVLRELIHPLDHQLMNEFGVRIEHSAKSVYNPGNQRCRPVDVKVPGDEELNDFLTCLGVMHGGIKVLDVQSLPPGFLFLREAGLDLSHDSGVLHANPSQPIMNNLDAREIPQFLPFLLILASSWMGITTITYDDHRLTRDERSSLSESVNLLNKMGCEVIVEAGTLTIPYRKLKPASVRLKNPRSILMTLLAASRCQGMDVLQIDKGEGIYPGLFSALRGLGMEISPKDEEQVFLLRVD